MAADCEVCLIVEGARGEIVLEADHFVVAISDRYPFGLAVLSKRHNDGLSDLTPDEAAELGAVLSITAAEMRASWTSWVYLTAFGEEVPHFHAMVHARFEPISEVFHQRLVEQVAEMEPVAEATWLEASAMGSDLRARWAARPR